MEYHPYSSKDLAAWELWRGPLAGEANELESSLDGVHMYGICVEGDSPWKDSFFPEQKLGPTLNAPAKRSISVPCLSICLPQVILAKI